MFLAAKTLPKRTPTTPGRPCALLLLRCTNSPASAARTPARRGVGQPARQRRATGGPTSQADLQSLGEAVWIGLSYAARVCVCVAPSRSFAAGG